VVSLRVSGFGFRVLAAFSFGSSMRFFSFIVLAYRVS
jgi:hypothetical protein